MGKKGDAQQQQSKRGADSRQRLPCIAHRRRPECADAVADDFHARHRGAAGREGPHHQPQRHRAGRVVQHGWRHHGTWMPAGSPGRPRAGAEDEQQRGQKQIGRDRQDQPGLLGAAQVHQGDQRQHAEAKRQGIGVQRRHGRDQRAHPGRDAHRDVQHVVHHQRRRGQQPGIGPEVLPRHRVGPAIAGVGADGLPIRQEQDQQQRQDRPGDRLHRTRPALPATTSTVSMASGP